jgi:transposase
MKLSRVGVDLAKNVYQLHGVDRHSKSVWKRRLRRGQWLQALLDKTEPGCEIGMEACTGAPLVNGNIQSGADARRKLALVSKENQNTIVRLIVLRQMKFRLVN